MLNLDYSILNNPQTRINFCEEVSNNIQDRTDFTYTNLAESIMSNLQLTYLWNLNHSLDGFKLVRKNFLHSLKLGMKPCKFFCEK